MLIVCELFVEQLRNRKTGSFYLDKEKNVIGRFSNLTLDNMIEIEKDEKISEFVVKNYSCNIWTEYTTSLFIYKTSLMKAEDKFTSFLKIGFSLDVKSNKFVVLQKVESGKALEQNLRTSDYYILVHPDYSDGYNKVNKLSFFTSRHKKH